MGRAVLTWAGAGLAVALFVGGCGALDPGAQPSATARTAATQSSSAPSTSTPTTGAGPSSLAGDRGAGAATLAVGHSARVAVSVATVWRSPDSPRPVDAPALRRPAGIETWLADLSLAQRRALNGRADTQALLGDRVVVLALPPSRPAWARVAVPLQPSPLDGRGYPGWVPRRQLTARAPTTSATRATVVSRTALLRTDRHPSARVFRISFGTSLPVVGATDRFVRVATPTGVVRRISRGAVVVHHPADPALAPTRASLVRAAKGFVGLPYLWAGASGFGVDCSGLTWLDYRVHGLRIPRDAEPQSQHGRPVDPPRRGDLMFYATSGVVHHVSMYVGHGRMVHSPGTGQAVQVIATSTPGYAREFSGARRYLP